jgi:UDP-N-acetyl-D-glucosamine dehydrogenase
LKKMENVYSRFVDTLVTVSKPSVAEFSKLLENSYRLVNISFVNELAQFARAMGIDFDEVVFAASSKPYGFETFYPSAGAGGHCIPVDPVYLEYEVRRSTGGRSRILSAALEVNREMPAAVVQVVEDSIGRLEGKSALVVGLSYKPGVADTRNSPALAVISLLLDKQVDVSVTDPLVKDVNVSGRVLESVSLSENVRFFDFAVILQLTDSEQAQTVEACSKSVIYADGRGASALLRRGVQT